jgi:hypothetical protein
VSAAAASLDRITRGERCAWLQIGFWVVVAAVLLV